MMLRPLLNYKYNELSVIVVYLCYFLSKYFVRGDARLLI
jgi:hypothetical protein